MFIYKDAFHFSFPWSHNRTAGEMHKASTAPPYASGFIWQHTEEFCYVGFHTNMIGVRQAPSDSNCRELSSIHTAPNAACMVVHKGHVEPYSGDFHPAKFWSVFCKQKLGIGPKQGSYINLLCVGSSPGFGLLSPHYRRVSVLFKRKNSNSFKNGYNVQC